MNKLSFYLLFIYTLDMHTRLDIKFFAHQPLWLVVFQVTSNLAFSLATISTPRPWGKTAI